MIAVLPLLYRFIYVDATDFTTHLRFAKQMWEGWTFYSVWTVPYQTDVRGILGPKLPTATSPDAVGDQPFLGLSSGTDVSGLWLKKS